MDYRDNNYLNNKHVWRNCIWRVLWVFSVTFMKGARLMTCSPWPGRAAKMSNESALAENIGRAVLAAVEKVLRTSLITSEIKRQIQDDIIVLIMIRLIGFFEHTCCLWLVSLDWVIWDHCEFLRWFKRGYVSIVETMISNAVIGCSAWLKNTPSFPLKPER